MLIPERTRRVHKIILPFFAVKLFIILLSLGVFFVVLVGLDYVHVLGRISENKRLKGENFKLRQEIQLIKNKVDSMETTLDRVRNYAKKLQILTGQSGEMPGDLPSGPTLEDDLSRSPSSKPLMPELLEPSSLNDESELNLTSKLERLQETSVTTELGLSKLQGFLLARSAIATATPSLIPIAGWLSSSFGYRRNPYDGTYRFHSGVDIAAEPGTPVRAPADGLVIFSGYREGYGKVVVIDHGYGIRTLFAHNSKLFVSPGVRTFRGGIISQVGSTGHATGPHLHYEVRKNGVPVNPVTFFSRLRF